MSNIDLSLEIALLEHLLCLKFIGENHSSIGTHFRMDFDKRISVARMHRTQLWWCEKLGTGVITYHETFADLCAALQTPAERRRLGLNTLPDKDSL